MQKLFSTLFIFMLFLFPNISFAEDSNKSAILIVSFGTSMPEARKAIDSLVNAVRENFPQIETRLAFTSNIIRRKIARESQEIIQNPVEALAKLNDENFSHVYVMPTHIIPGEEYDEIQNVVNAFRTIKGKYGFKRLELGRPFLDGAFDCEGMADILIERFKQYISSKDTGIVLMGHGTPEHFANALYSQLQLALDTKEYGKFFLGTVEAAPKIDDVIAKLKRRPEIKKLILSPFMIVAGDHANNDLAGADDEESWLNILKRNGYEDITTYLVGLGEDENIKRQFVRKILELIDTK